MELLPAHVFQVSLEIPMCNVNQSAQLIQNAQQTRPVLIRSVWTLVQEFVELMLHAQSRITIHHAHVTLAILGTHSDTALKLQHKQFQLKSLIHATHLPVDQMQSAMKETEQPPVNVFQTTLETHMLPADQNVQQMLNVHLPKHVKTCIVWTHVQVLDVESMLNVK